MFRRSVNLKVVALKLFLIIVFLTGGANGVSAKGLESELWGIDWTSNSRQIVQTLERQGFIFDGQGNDADGKWLKMANGKFLEYQCTVKTIWDDKDISKIIIYLTEEGPRTELVYQEIAKYFQQNYGSPSNTDRYYLESNPPVKVDVIGWRVNIEEDKFLNVFLTRNCTVDLSGKESADSRIEIAVIKSYPEAIRKTNF